MNKILNIGVSIFGLLAINAQVGINTTTPDAGSILDIRSSEKAVLLPRLDITNLNSISPVTGGSPVSLLAYNANMTTGPGFYFWNGIVWTPIDNNRNWILRGNTGASSPLNVLGTIDNNAFKIRTNNDNRIEFDLNGAVLSHSIGSNTSPNFSWFNDSDTGFYNPAANQIAYSLGGVQLFRFDENGRLKLGNNTQTANYDVSIDKGNAQPSNLHFTVGTTTGTAATDGFQIGLDASSQLSINNREDFSLFIDTENINRFQVIRIPSNGNDLRKRKFNNSVTNLDGMVINSFGSGQSVGVGSMFSHSTSSSNGPGYGSANINFTDISIKYANDGWPNSYAYTFGLAGYHRPDANTNRSGGVIGYYALDNGSFRSSGYLGYRANNNTYYGAYGSSAYSNGSGFSQNSIVANSVGVMGFGGLVGQISRGQMIGNISSGQMSSNYAKGHVFTSGKNIELVESEIGQLPLYATTSLTNKLFENGLDQLVNGQKEVFFDKSIINQIDNELPVITLSAFGDNKGLYIKSINKNSFIVAEQNGGQSNVNFSWMMIANRKNQINLAKVNDFLDKDFDRNLTKHLISDNDPEAETKNTSMWYDGSKIRFDKMPEQLESRAGSPASIKTLE